AVLGHLQDVRRWQTSRQRALLATSVQVAHEQDARAEVLDQQHVAVVVLTDSASVWAWIVDVGRHATSPVENLTSLQIRHRQVALLDLGPERAPRLRGIDLPGP